MATTETSLPDYAPVPRSALGPALNDQGYYVGRVERNLYWVTDGTYQSAFLTTVRRRGPARRPAHHRPQHPAGRRRDRRGERREQQGHPPHLLAPPRRPRRRVLPVRQGRRSHRTRGDPPAPATRRRPGQARSRGDVPGPAQPGDRRRAHRPGLVRLQPLARQHLHPPAGPRHADARRHRQRRLGARLPVQPHRGHPRLHRGAGQCPRLSVEALHRRPQRPARHPRRRDPAPAVHGRHRRQRQTGDRHRRSDPLLREVRRERRGPR